MKDTKRITTILIFTCLLVGIVIGIVLKTEFIRFPEEEKVDPISMQVNKTAFNMTGRNTTSFNVTLDANQEVYGIRLLFYPQDVPVNIKIEEMGWHGKISVKNESTEGCQVLNISQYFYKYSLHGTINYPFHVEEHLNKGDTRWINITIERPPNIPMRYCPNVSTITLELSYFAEHTGENWEEATQKKKLIIWEEEG